MTYQTDTEHIVDLTRRNLSLAATNKYLTKSLQNIRRMLVCIGGPLNDNVRQYTNEQREIFYRIEDEIIKAGVEDGEE